jgi:hypothetical protein
MSTEARVFVALLVIATALALTLGAMTTSGRASSSPTVPTVTTCPPRDVTDALAATGYVPTPASSYDPEDC